MGKVVEGSEDDDNNSGNDNIITSNQPEHLDVVTSWGHLPNNGDKKRASAKVKKLAPKKVNAKQTSENVRVTRMERSRAGCKKNNKKTGAG